MKQAKIGIIGLAVMGANLARNIAGHGFGTVVFNRTSEKTKKFLQDFGNKNLSGEMTLKKFVATLEKPRKIILMVKAGEAIDELIAQLKPLLSRSDIIIDGGNSHYMDTERRQNDLSKRGIHLIGMGISGGEEGALNGPSLMPGGEQKAYRQVSKILETIAAKDGSDGKCVTYLGPGASGHFVKMVHNGIEYAVMQVIAESYDLLKKSGRLPNKKLAEIFDRWNKENQSFLLEITTKIFNHKNLIDLIKDSAEQKGTGKWASEAAFDLGVSTPGIHAAVDARIISGAIKNRQAGKNFPKSINKIKIPKNLIELVRDAIELSTICCYFQGFDLLQTAKEKNNWNLDLSEIARIWQGGCIIRSKLLEKFQGAFSKNAKKAKIAKQKLIQNFQGKPQQNWRSIIALGIQNGIPLSAMAASLSYYDAINAKKLPQNLIQAQRDFFGAHGYERMDKKGNFHTSW